MSQATGQKDPTNELPIHFDIIIDEPVVDFPTGINTPGVQVSGTATGLRYSVEGSRDRYRLSVLSIEGDGTIEIAVPDAVCADLFGNLNVASTATDATVTFDGSRPACLIHSEASGVVSNASLDIVVGFSEPVYGLQDRALTAENATIRRKAGQDGDAIYIFEVTPRQDGVINLQVPDDAARDTVGNGSLASAVFALAVDSTGPEVALTSFETPQASNARLIRIRAEFNEPVQGFDQSDLRVERGSLVSFTPEADGRTFIIDMRQQRGPVTLSIPAGAATDVIGNPNTASATFHRDYEPARPAATITAQTSGRFAGEPVLVEVRFNKPVYRTAAEILTVAGAEAEFLSGRDGGATFTWRIPAPGSEPIGLIIEESVVRDAAGNGNRAARTQFTLRARPAQVEAEPGVVAPPLTKP